MRIKFITMLVALFALPISVNADTAKALVAGGIGGAVGGAIVGVMNGPSSTTEDISNDTFVLEYDATTTIRATNFYIDVDTNTRMARFANFGDYTNIQTIATKVLMMKSPVLINVKRVLHNNYVLYLLTFKDTYVKTRTSY